jgi:hypothetical protein
MLNRPPWLHSHRRTLALTLVVVAVAMIVVEPFPHGRVLLALTATHGVEVGDLPAVGLLLVAVWLVR